MKKKEVTVMNQKNRYKFVFGNKPLTLTTDKDNLFMEEVERLAKEKYEAIKAKLPQADDETVAILMAINSLSVQLTRELELTRKDMDNAQKEEKIALPENLKTDETKEGTEE